MIALCGKKLDFQPGFELAVAEGALTPEIAADKALAAFRSKS